MNFSHICKLEFLREPWFPHQVSSCQFRTPTLDFKEMPESCSFAHPPEGRERLLIRANGKVMALSPLEGLWQDEAEWKLQSPMSCSGIR